VSDHRLDSLLTPANAAGIYAKWTGSFCRFITAAALGAWPFWRTTCSPGLYNRATTRRCAVGFVAMPPSRDLPYMLPSQDWPKIRKRTA
jgi:hypothetical protein